MIVRTTNEFRRDAIFLPVSFEEFWNSEIHQDHIKPRRVHLSRVMRELFIVIAGGACCRASQSCRLGRTSRPLGKNKMRRTWLQTKFALLTACYRHSVGAF
jgi:hypothetical protein